MKQDTRNFRDDFPIFKKNPDLTYLDSAASALKPQCVLNAVNRYYTEYSSNISRGLYPFSEKATAEYERVRDIVAKFLNASSREEIVFTKNTTESLNLLAYTLFEKLDSQDEIAITAMEHHANFVPWVELARKRDTRLTIIPFEEDAPLNPKILKKYITPNTKIFSFVHASNVLGTINPARAIIAEVKQLNPNIITLIDAAQSVAHTPLNVQEMKCDFLAFSSHKTFGPTGAGVLWGRKERLNALPPFLYGGEMVESVSPEKTVFKDAPHRFEAGTPAIGEVIGMGAAIEYIQRIGFNAIQSYESDLAQYTLQKLTVTFGNAIRILGPHDDRVPLFSFALDDIHPHDIAQILAEENICIRAGSHCAMPLHQSLHLDFPASARISLSIYNTKEDIDSCVEALKNALQTFDR